jgi:hypothetical protein
MSQATAPTSEPTDNSPSDKPKPPAAAVGNVPFSLVLLSAILALLPGTRSTGIVLLVLLAIPALVVWARARDLTDASRGLTTSTLVIGISALVLGAVMGPHEEAPTTNPASAPPAVPQLTAPASPPVAVAPAQPAKRPIPTVARTARVVPMPAPQTAEAEQSDQSAAYYKNCAAARAAGAAPLRTGDPGYRAGLDRDGDGIACE